MTRSVIVAAVRTPVGRFGSALRSRSAVELGAVAIAEAVARAGVAPSEVDYVLMGHVLQAGTGQITARQAAVAAGIPSQVPAMTLNKVCLSSLTAVALADQLIRAGELEVAVAGGMESMTNAPYVLPRARWGVRMGPAELVDSMIHDGLWSSFTGQHMGQSSDEVNAALEVSREEQDAWAARSHQRAAAAWASGRFAAEVTGVQIQERLDATSVVERDEGIRPQTTRETLAALPPAFTPTGTITAGNASQLSDGAAAVVVMSPARARALGVAPLAEIVTYGMCADRFAYLHTVPAIALETALKKAGKSVDDLGLLEVNEAFASVAVHAARMLGVNDAIVNVNGGSVALGHALGSTGARMIVTLVHELRRRNLEYGAVTLCGGGGQGDALLLRVPSPHDPWL
ncbi:MAG TPA: acetyl-CoA C-acetyltransferase [Actinomycetota bacterium]|nr:acetyl-CoA C-acetyltransferase [Actinomycetota bacterium]